MLCSGILASVSIIRVVISLWLIIDTYSYCSGSRRVLEIRKLLASLKHAEEMLSNVNKIENSLTAIHTQNLKQTKIDLFQNCDKIENM